MVTSFYICIIFFFFTFDVIFTYVTKFFSYVGGFTFVGIFTFDGLTACIRPGVTMVTSPEGTVFR